MKTKYSRQFGSDCVTVTRDDVSIVGNYNSNFGKVYSHNIGRSYPYPLINQEYSLFGMDWGYGITPRVQAYITHAIKRLHRKRTKNCAIFICAGDDYGKQNEIVFLHSHQRHYFIPNTIFHRNDHSTLYRIPVEFLRKNFKYNGSTGIYETKLTYGDIREFKTLWVH